MIAIAIAAALVAYAWIMGYLGQTTHKTELAIQIQSVTSINENGKDWLMFYVQNVGQGIVHLQQDTSVYVNDFGRNIASSPKDTTLSAGTILPLQISQTAELKMDCYYTQGEYLKIKVVTTEGTTAELTIQGTNNNQAPLPPGTITHTLTVNTIGNGIVSKNPNKSLYKHADVVQLLASTYPGWQFTQWSGDATGNTNPTTIAMLSDKTVTATFTQKEYTLVINKNGEGTITQTPPGPTYHLGDPVTLTATPDTANGWKFAGWTGDVTSHDIQTTVTIDETPEVTATFTQETYSLTTTINPPNGGTITRNASEPYNQGQKIELTATPNTGFAFTGWSGDATGTVNPTTVTITGNMVVTANFEQNAVTLTLNANPPAGGTIAPNVMGPYKYGDQVQLTAITNTGYTFTGWTGDLSGVASPTWITLDGNKAVTAIFTQKEYSLLVYISGSGTVTKNPDQTTYHYGDAVQLTATPSANWDFAGWTSDLNSHDTQITLTIDETPQITATFTQIPPDQYSLTVTSNPLEGGFTDLNPLGPTYAVNTVVTLTPRPNPGYMFTGFAGDIVSGPTDSAQINMTKDMAVTAYFARIPATLTLIVNPTGTGTIAASPPNPYFVGDAVQLTANPSAGYLFSQWSGGVTGTTNPSAITLSGDTTVTATFTQKEYTLVITKIGSGTITQTPGPYHLGDRVTLTATPSANWNFAGWSGDIDSSSSQVSLTIDENPAVTATFVQSDYTLTVTPTEGGTVAKNPDQTAYHYGDRVTLTATHATGYTFTGWSGDLTGSVNPTQIIITGNMIVTAHFARIPVTLTLNYNPLQGSVTASPGGPYLYGDTVQLTANPATDPGTGYDYTFTSWGGDLISTANPASITLNGDKTVTASFQLNPQQTVLNVGFDTPGNGWDRDWDEWTNPPWRQSANGEGYGNVLYSATSSSSVGDYGRFSSVAKFADDADATHRTTAIHVTFQYRVLNTNSANDLTMWYSGQTNPSGGGNTGWTQVPGGIGTPGDTQWHQGSVTITDPSAFTSTFRFRFYSNLATHGGYSEQVWIDDVVITVDLS